MGTSFSRLHFCLRNVEYARIYQCPLRSHIALNIPSGFSSSSSGAPVSTILPLSITMIRSKSTIVLSRCAIAMTVLSANSVRINESIVSSVAVSRELLIYYSVSGERSQKLQSMRPDLIIEGTCFLPHRRLRV